MNKVLKGGVKTVYKIKDTTTGKFWNGSVSRTSLDDAGKTFTSLKQVQNYISSFMRNANRRTGITIPPRQWEIAEYEVTISEKSTYSIDAIIFHNLMKDEISKVDYKLAYCYDVLVSRKVADQVQFILRIKPDDMTTWITSERIQEARAQLRQLGVKTRTFKEYNGMFGMMDREQAMRARLTLDIDTAVDLNDVREKVKAKMVPPPPVVTDDNDDNPVDMLALDAMIKQYAK